MTTDRLDEKTKFTLNRISEKEDRSAASIVKEGLRLLLKNTDVLYLDHSGLNSTQSYEHALDLVWHPDPVERFVNMAYHAPTLFNDPEREMWVLIKDTGELWLKRERLERERLKREDGSEYWRYKTDRENLDKEALRDHWAELLEKSGLKSKDDWQLPSD